VSGAFLALVGIWVISQVLKGGAVDRLLSPAPSGPQALPEQQGPVGGPGGFPTNGSGETQGPLGGPNGFPVVPGG
jgi:hypothetical protein